MIVSRKSLITLPCMDSSLRLWVNEAMTCGPDGSGAVFCPTEKRRDDCLFWVRTALPTYVESKASFNPITYRIVTAASLSVHLIDSIQAAAEVVDTWPFIIIDDPMSWPDSRLLRFLTTRLAPRLGTRMTMVTVGSSLNLETLPVDKFDDISSVKEIDYSKITRFLST